MKLFKKEFRSPINREYSMMATVIPVLKDALSSMEVWINLDEVAGTGTSQIEWVWGIDTEDEDVEHIGIWWENGELTDYDGVFDLPLPAIELIESAGIKVDRNDFGPDITN